MLRATPILITFFGLSLAYLARIWNIGSEGQILLGAVASAWIGLRLGGLEILGIIVSIVFGGLCGRL
jgi:simple sugar transport system permease protein